ncbi:TetR/AcrR family transcriptional regulator [Pseudonocardia spinosispora]|uniref:TetR/AcrR family transcriptional regulator n=1 Tax=Pseudonocardia spinosispora TaxID=103441 RepID=UPI0004276A94|nr:TetR/AcrR family transcriptional regulator [Pseudonocardia spinosispora]
MTTPQGSAGRSEARERLLATASRLFYREGIRSVGVERILAEAPATRATFYRHYPSRDDLVLAYLGSVDTQLRAQVRAAIDAVASAADAVRAVGATVADALGTPGFLGCALLRAAAEFPHSDDPVHRVVAEHRAWFATTMTGLFAQVYGSEPGRPRVDHAAQHFVMLRDGAMSAAHIDHAEDIAMVFQRGVEGLLAVLHTGPDHGAGPQPRWPS